MCVAVSNASTCCGITQRSTQSAYQVTLPAEKEQLSKIQGYGCTDWRGVSSSSCSFLEHFVTSSPLGPNVRLNTLLSKPSEHVPYQCETTDKTMIMYISVFIFLDSRWGRSLPQSQKVFPEYKALIVFMNTYLSVRFYCLSETSAVLPHYCHCCILHGGDKMWAHSLLSLHLLKHVDQTLSLRSIELQCLSS